MCAQDLCSDISRELVLDLTDSSRLGAIQGNPACTSVLRCLGQILHLTCIGSR